MTLIENPEDILFTSDMWNVSVLFVGKSVDFEWDKDESWNEEVEFVTLHDIQKQLEDKYPCFMVIAETLFGGAVYRFNNYGKAEWYQIGTLCGFA